MLVSISTHGIEHSNITPGQKDGRDRRAAVKHTVAEQLRAEIVSGALKPGSRIVEGNWGSKFGVAQGSVREAISFLAQEGSVTKAPRPKRTRRAPE